MEVQENTRYSDKFLLFLDIIVVMFTVSTLIVNIIINHVCFKAVVEGTSMEDTYHEGDTLIVWRKHTVQRGDIVAFKDPENNSKMLIKRCIAIPGDTIVIENNGVYVNNEKVCETYIKNNYTGSPGVLKESIKLQNNEYIMLGDNREVSIDSRNFGVVNKSYIQGIINKD